MIKAYKNLLIIFVLVISVSILTACYREEHKNINKLTEDSDDIEVGEVDSSTKEEIEPARMVRVNSKIYMEMGYVNSVNISDVADGLILTSVDRTMMPENDDESNFGKGYYYKYLDNTHINVKMNNRWIVFQDLAISSWIIPDCVAHFTAEVKTLMKTI